MVFIILKKVLTKPEVHRRVCVSVCVCRAQVEKLGKIFLLWALGERPQGKIIGMALISVSNFSLFYFISKLISSSVEFHRSDVNHTKQCFLLDVFHIITSLFNLISKSANCLTVPVCEFQFHTFSFEFFVTGWARFSGKLEVGCVSRSLFAVCLLSS